LLFKKWQESLKKLVLVEIETVYAAFAADTPAAEVSVT